MGYFSEPGRGSVEQATATGSPVNVAVASAGTAVATAPTAAPELEQVQGAVLSALEEAGQRMAAMALEEGEWALSSTQMTIRVSSSEQMIAMTFGPEQRRVIQQAIQSTLGRPLGLAVLPGAAKQKVEKPAVRAANPGGIRGKAAQHPVVRRMTEKFGAELRTVLDSDQ